MITFGLPPDCALALGPARSLAAIAHSAIARASTAAFLPVPRRTPLPGAEPAMVFPKRTRPPRVAIRAWVPGRPEVKTRRPSGGRGEFRRGPGLAQAAGELLGELGDRDPRLVQ